MEIFSSKKKCLGKKDVGRPIVTVLVSNSSCRYFLRKGRGMFLLTTKQNKTVITTEIKHAPNISEIS